MRAIDRKEKGIQSFLVIDSRTGQRDICPRGKAVVYKVISPENYMEFLKVKPISGGTGEVF